MGFERIEGITTGEPNNEDSWVRIPDQLTYIGSPWSLVSGRFDKTAELAEDTYKTASTYIAKLDDLINDLQEYKSGPIEIELPEIGSLGVLARPGFGDLDLGAIRWPDNTAVRPTLDELPSIEGVEIPGFDLRPPSYTNIEAPVLPDRTAPQKPTLSDIEAPPEPDYVVPEPPTLGEIQYPDKPELSLAEFEASLDEIDWNDIPLPEDFSWEESPYNSEIWNTFLTTVRDGIINGGTGLSPEVEEAIYARANRRQEAANDQAFREAEKYFAARGFPLPPGAMASRINEITAEILKAKTDVNEQIIVSQAELAQKNTHFMIEMGWKAEQILRDFHNARENRLLEASRTVVQMSVEVMKAYIGRQTLGIEAFKAKVVAYSENVRAVLARVDIYKAEIEALKVTADLQNAEVSLYSAQIGALETIAKLYNSRLQSVEILQRVESLKIEIFKAETAAFEASLAADKNQVDIYSAKTDAERIKAVTYGEQVKARAAEIEAKKIELEVQVTELNAVVQKNTAELNRYQLELNAYSTQVDAVAKESGLTVDAYKAEISAYIAENSALDSVTSIKLKEADMRIEEARLNLEKSLAEIKAEVDTYMAVKELQLKGTEGIMDVSAQMTASALTAVHASANYGYSGSSSISHGFSYGANISESHSIPHDPPQ